MGVLARPAVLAPVCARVAEAGGAARRASVGGARAVGVDGAGLGRGSVLGRLVARLNLDAVRLPRSVLVSARRARGAVGSAGLFLVGSLA